MRAFVSHNSKDRALVEQIAAELLAVGIVAYIYEHDPQPGHSVTEKVQNAIAQSEVMVVLLTRDGVASTYVQQEIGFAVAKHKLVIPLVEQSLTSTDLAMLNGVEYFKFDREDARPATLALADYLRRMGEDKAQAQQELLVGLLVASLILIVLVSASGASEAATST